MPLPQATAVAPVAENKKEPPKSTFGGFYQVGYF